MSTIQKGIVSTTEVLQDSMKVDMREEMSLLDADESQFSTFTMKSRKGTATREKINWREKDLFPRIVDVAGAGVASAGTALTVGSAQGARVLRGDVLRNMTKGDAAWVSATPAADVVTIVKNIGAKGDLAWAAGEKLLITSNAHPQGADFPDTAILLPTLGYNYTQIFRHGWSFSRTARAVDYYGRGEPADEQSMKGLQHKRAIEYSGFFGARAQPLDPTTGEPVGIAGGLVEFITTNILDANAVYSGEAAGILTVDELDNFLKSALRYSGRNVVMYVSPGFAMAVSKFNRGGQGTAWRAEPSNVAGLKVDAFMSGVYGYEIPIVVKKDWLDFPSTPASNLSYGSWAFVVDHDKVEYKTLTGGDTALLTNRQHPGGDRVSEEFLTEATWEIRNQAAHGIIKGVA